MKQVVCLLERTVEVKKQGFNNSSLPPRVNTLYRLEEWRGEQRVLGANFTLKVYLHNPLVGRCRIGTTVTRRATTCRATTCRATTCRFFKKCQLVARQLAAGPSCRATTCRFSTCRLANLSPRQFKISTLVPELPEKLQKIAAILNWVRLGLIEISQDQRHRNINAAF
jgi:hypothetical protein